MKLQSRHRVQLRIFRGKARLKAGERVELWGFNADRGRLDVGVRKHHKNPLGGVEHNIAKRRVRTDFRGRCYFGDLPAGNYTVHWGGRVITQGGGFEFEVDAGQLPRVIEVR